MQRHAGSLRCLLGSLSRHMQACRVTREAPAAPDKVAKPPREACGASLEACLGARQLAEGRVKLPSRPSTLRSHAGSLSRAIGSLIRRVEACRAEREASTPSVIVAASRRKLASRPPQAYRAALQASGGVFERPKTEIFPSQGRAPDHRAVHRCPHLRPLLVEIERRGAGPRLYRLDRAQLPRTR